MKKNWLKTMSIAGILLGSLLTSCSEATLEDDFSAEQAVSLKSAAEDAEINEITDGSSDIIEEVYLEEEVLTTKSSTADRYLPDCVTITKVIADQVKTVSIDFGEGCTLRNGNFLSGIITMTYTLNPDEATKTINYVYSDFQFNRKTVNGGGTILRERANAQGNPQSTKTFDVTVTWADGSVSKREGERVREMIEGKSTAAWGDNVFSITGHWNYTRKNGVEISNRIVEALRRELACKFTVSGSIEMTKGDQVGLLDFGNGDCDDLATISINGGEAREFHLGQ